LHAGGIDLSRPRANQCFFCALQLTGGKGKEGEGGERAFITRKPPTSETSGAFERGEEGKGREKKEPRADHQEGQSLVCNGHESRKIKREKGGGKKGKKGKEKKGSRTGGRPSTGRVRRGLADEDLANRSKEGGGGGRGRKRGEGGETRHRSPERAANDCPSLLSPNNIWKRKNVRTIG